MLRSGNRIRVAAIWLAGGLLSTTLLAADWPQWRGPDRDGLSAETKLMKDWPAAGPKLLWTAKGLGAGHSTPSISKGKVFGMGLRGNDEVVWALDLKTGNELWHTRIAGPARLDAMQGGNGPRATPTVDGNFAYTIGAGGDLVCVNTSSGALVWKKSLVSDFGGAVPTWGYCESPLVDGNKVIVTPGGSNTIVALNKATGATLWKSSVSYGNGASYSSCILASVDGQKQYIQFLSGGVVGIDAKDGKFLWRFDGPSNRSNINCSTPIYRDNHVFAASSYGHGGALAKLTGGPDGTTAKQVYFTREMKNHHGGMVVVGNYLYGFDENNLTCIEFLTGKTMWSNRSVGKGSVMYADGRIYARSERGAVALVEANPNQYVEHGRFEQPSRSNEASWPYPIIANGKLYLRDQDNLLCYDVSAG